VQGGFFISRPLTASGNEIAFQVQGKPVFELPMAHVVNSNIAGKAEVALEFNPPPPYRPSPKDPDASRFRQIDELVEMRFYVPGKSKKTKSGSDDGENGDGSDGDVTDYDDDGNAVTAADALHQLIKDKADIGAIVGDSIVMFEDILVLTPRSATFRPARNVTS
jgi:structure-specific recognition protein 1